MKFKSDIDIDMADRQKLLNLIKYTPASIINDQNISTHNTGIYVTDIPTDTLANRASIDYRQAEDRGYVKLDLLNVNLYRQVESEQHLDQLLTQEPPWHRLYEQDFCQQLIHIGNHYQTLVAMPEAVNTIARLAMFLAVIRPSKRHLIGKTWARVADTIWEKPQEGYYFKKSHSVAYAHLVVVNMNLLANQGV